MRMKTDNEKNVKEYFFWPEQISYTLVLWAVIPTLLYQYFNMKWIVIPWIPVALVGITTAIVVAMKNTQMQKRLADAGLIWNNIITQSTDWNTTVQHFIPKSNSAYKTLVHNQYAWIMLLRFQLKHNNNQPGPAAMQALKNELANYIAPERLNDILLQKNSAKQLIALQSVIIKELYNNQQITNQQYIEMLRKLADLYDLQQQCEKITNYTPNGFFSRINLVMIRLFIILLPFGLINEFRKLGSDFVLLTIPFCLLISCVFTLIERTAKKPFDLGLNDSSTQKLAKIEL